MITRELSNPNRLNQVHFMIVLHNRGLGGHGSKRECGMYPGPKTAKAAIQQELTSVIKQLSRIK